MLKENFTGYLRDSINRNWEYRALSDYQGESFTYGEIAGYIRYLHDLFHSTGVRQGDKVALVGKNSARWCIVYLSAVTYGAIIVPVLPDFKPGVLQEIVDHSDSVLLFADDQVLEKTKTDAMPQLSGIFNLSGFSLEYHRDPALKFHYDKLDPQKIFTETKDQKKIDFQDIPNDQLAVISYTSGTTGFTKGVMLAHNSLAANMRFAQANMPLNPGDKIVSFLPLAHTFGGAFEFLFPFTLGCDITILTKTPSPQVIMKAFQEIKPSLILSVPLVIEKIYKKQILPVTSKRLMKVLLMIPGLNQVILKKIRKKLTDVFGGNFRELVIGGAPLNKEAEKFFRRIKFPFTVGYGMTECGPLISYLNWKDFKLSSAGRSVDTLEVKVDSPDPEKISGEILVRGDNVMKGYYKNEKATKEVLDEDGWLHTGDLGTIDHAGNICIRGRVKSMILGPSGKNIYPEEIESIFNNKYAVGETLVVERKDKLVALIYPDKEVAERDGLTDDDLLELFRHHMKAVNHKTPAYMNLSSVELHSEEFNKTPKRSIKRYLYNQP